MVNEQSSRDGPRDAAETRFLPQIHRVKLSNKEKLYIAGTLLGSVLASIGAYHLVNKFLSHRLGEMPELAAGLAFIVVFAICKKACDELRRESVEQARADDREYFRNLNSS